MTMRSPRPSTVAPVVTSKVPPVGLWHTTETPWSSQAGLHEAHVGELRRYGHLGEHEVPVELEVLLDRGDDPVRHPPPRVTLGEHDVVRTDALQDPAVLLGERLGPDLGYAQLRQVGGGEDAVLEGRTDRDDRPLDVAHTELSERVDVGGAADLGVGQELLAGLHEGLVGVDAHHLVALVVELLGEGRAEAAQADDHDGVGLSSPSQ